MHEKIQSIEFYLAPFSNLTTTLKKSYGKNKILFQTDLFYRDVCECLIILERMFLRKINHRLALFNSSKRAENQTEFSFQFLDRELSCYTHIDYIIWYIDYSV